MPIPPWGADQAYACVDCPAGTARAETQQTFACTECPVGKYSVGGQAECSVCDNPQVPDRNTAGAKSCILCASGKGANAAGTACDDCNVGMFSSAGACERCTGDTVPNRERAATACIRCPDQTQIGVNGSCICRPEYYNTSEGLLECVDSDSGFETSQVEPRACQECPACGVCDGSSRPLVRSGFIELPASVTDRWKRRFGSQAVRLAFRCDIHRGGQDDSNACAPRFPGDTSGYPDRSISSACAAGRTGYLCQSCAEDYHTVQYRCVQCKTSEFRPLAWYGVCATIVAAAFATHRSKIREWTIARTKRSDKNLPLESSIVTALREYGTDNPAEASANVEDDTTPGSSWREENDIVAPPEKNGKWLHLRVLFRAAFQPLRMVVTWVQITSQIGGVLHVHYPPQFASAVDALRFLNDVFSMLVDSECEGLDGFATQWTLKVIVLPSVAGSVVTGAYLWLHSQQGAAYAAQQAKSYGYGFIFLLYPSICNTAFAAFECRELIVDQQPQILEVDDRVLCDDDEMQILQKLSLIVIIVVAIGVPVLFSVLLVRNARKYQLTNSVLNDAVAARLAQEFEVDPKVADYILRDVTAMGQSFGFLMDAYTFECYYWETLDLLRKLMLVGLVLLVRRGSVAQNMVALVLSFFFFALQTSTRPYKLPQDNALRAATEVQVFLVIASGLALHSDLSGEQVDATWYDYGLAVSFVVLVPGAFCVTVASKMRAANKTLSDDSLKGSFSRLQFGLASDDDRVQIFKHAEAVESSLSPLYEAGIAYDPDQPIEGAQDASVAGTRLCFGEYKATATGEPIECAIKIRHLAVEGVHKEAALMMSLAAQHVNVIRVYRAVVSDDHHYLAMQLCQTTVQRAIRAGNLQTLLGQTTDVEMLRRLAEGVNAIHDAGFVHNNVTPSNVLLLDGVPKLSGFSSVAQISQPTVLDTTRTTFEHAWYQAPELKTTSGSCWNSIESLHPKAADVYALGATFHFVLTGGNTAGTRNSVERSEDLSHEARDLIGHMLEENAEGRPSVQVVLSHPMFWSVDEKIRYLAQSVGLILPVKIHKSKVPFISDLEAIADRELGGSYESGGSWARQLDSRYPLPGVNNDGWGKAQRPPAEEERNYAIYGGPPSKKQVKEREALVAAGKPLGGHTAKEIRMVGLLKLIRNLDAHAGQAVAAGRFESEGALRRYLLEPFPWLTMAVYRTDEKYGLTDVPKAAAAQASGGAAATGEGVAEL